MLAQDCVCYFGSIGVQWDYWDVERDLEWIVESIDFTCRASALLTEDIFMTLSSIYIYFIESISKYHAWMSEFDKCFPEIPEMSVHAGFVSLLCWYRVSHASRCTCSAILVFQR